MNTIMKYNQLKWLCRRIISHKQHDFSQGHSSTMNLIEYETALIVDVIYGTKLESFKLLVCPHLEYVNRDTSSYQ